VIEIFLVSCAFERNFDCKTIKLSVKLLNLFDRNTKGKEREIEIVNEPFLLGSFTMPVILQPIKFKSKAV
jgi:hypothetical protein